MLIISYLYDAGKKAVPANEDTFQLGSTNHNSESTEQKIVMLNIIGIGRERLRMVKSGNPYSARGLWTCQMFVSIGRMVK